MLDLEVFGVVLFLGEVLVLVVGDLSLIFIGPFFCCLFSFISSFLFGILNNSVSSVFMFGCICIEGIGVVIIGFPYLSFRVMLIGILPSFGICITGNLWYKLFGFMVLLGLNVNGYILCGPGCILMLFCLRELPDFGLFLFVFRFFFVVFFDFGVFVFFCFIGSRGS